MSRHKAFFSATPKESHPSRPQPAAVGPQTVGGERRATPLQSGCQPSRLPGDAQRMALSAAQLWPTCHRALPSGPHTSMILVPGVAPLSPHWLLLQPPHCPPLVLKGRGSSPILTLTQGMSSMPWCPRATPASHLYQDGLHTFVIKGSVQCKEF